MQIAKEKRAEKKLNCGWRTWPTKGEAEKKHTASLPKHETRIFLHTLNCNFSPRRLQKKVSENEREKVESYEWGDDDQKVQKFVVIIQLLMSQDSNTYKWFKPELLFNQAKMLFLILHHCLTICPWKSLSKDVSCLRASSVALLLSFFVHILKKNSRATQSSSRCVQ